jgi:hypothetical protein
MRPDQVYAKAKKKYSLLNRRVSNISRKGGKKRGVMLELSSGNIM